MLCSCSIFNLIYFIAVLLVCFGCRETSSSLLAGPKLIHYFRVLFAHFYKNIFVWSETFVLLEISAESLFCRVHWFVVVTKYFYPKFFILSSARGKCLPFSKGVPLEFAVVRFHSLVEIFMRFMFSCFAEFVEAVIFEFELDNFTSSTLNQSRGNFIFVHILEFLKH